MMIILHYITIRILPIFNNVSLTVMAYFCLFFKLTRQPLPTVFYCLFIANLFNIPNHSVFVIFNMTRQASQHDTLRVV